MAKTHNRIEDLQQQMIEDLNQKIEELTQENESLTAQLAIEMAKSIVAEKRAEEFEKLIEELKELKRDYLSKLALIEDIKKKFEKESQNILKEIKRDFKK